MEQDGLLLKVTTRPADQVVPQIINIVAQCCEIRNIAVREPNLEEVFLRLTGKALRD